MTARLEAETAAKEALEKELHSSEEVKRAELDATIKRLAAEREEALKQVKIEQAAKDALVAEREEALKKVQSEQAAKDAIAAEREEALKKVEIEQAAKDAIAAEREEALKQE